MVFQKVRAASDELRRHAQQVTLDFGVAAIGEVIVESFVVRVIKAERLQPRFEIPIDLAQEKEIRVRLFDDSNRVSPKYAFSHGGGAGETLPGFGEHVVQQQHRHVAAHAIAALGDGLQLLNHRGAGVGAAVVELNRVNPEI